MDFEFVCGWCDEENILTGEQTGFWGTRYLVDSEWDCWACGGTNTTPDPPWTEAE